MRPRAIAATAPRQLLRIGVPGETEERRLAGGHALENSRDPGWLRMLAFHGLQMPWLEKACTSWLRSKTGDDPKGGVTYDDPAGRDR